MCARGYHLDTATDLIRSHRVTRLRNLGPGIIWGFFLWSRRLPMVRNLSDLRPIGARVNVRRSACLAPQPAVDHWERQPRPELRYQDVERHYVIVVASIAPAEDPGYVAGQVGQGWRGRIVVAHRGRLRVIRGKWEERDSKG